MTDEKKIIKKPKMILNLMCIRKPDFKRKLKNRKEKALNHFLSLRLAVPLHSPCLQVSALTV